MVALEDMTNSRVPRAEFLKPTSRLFLLALLAASLLCGLIFFYWAQNQCSLPKLYFDQPHFLPWIDLRETLDSTSSNGWLITLWNASLFLIFGFIHSLTAQTPFQNRLLKVAPIQAHRTLYLFITALTLGSVMGLWQNTGIVLWSIPLPRWTGLITFWSFITLSFILLAQFNPLSFIGLNQLYSSKKPTSEVTPTQLSTHGLRHWIRHPVYTCLILALSITPLMTLDRMTLVVSTCAYLAFAIPVEERKLIAIFGNDYIRYKKNTGTLFPKLFAPKQHN